MRIALLQPTYWPEVRRGSERLVHDLAASLVALGHDVTLITSHRRRPSVELDGGVRVIRRWRPAERTPLSWYEHHIANAPGVAWHLARADYDVAHAFFAVEGWAALKVRRVGGPPVAFSFHGIPNRPYLVRRRYRLEMLEGLVGAADHVSVLSNAAAERFREYFPRDPDVLPGGVLPGQFSSRARRAREPTLICAASLGDPRKRAGLLFEAFAKLREQRPSARLRVVRAADPVMSGSTPALPPGADWVDGDRADRLADAFASAWASVLPSVEEAFGLVLLESLAAGTPAVAARSGACPEILDRDGIGSLFEPDDPGSLARGMDEAIKLSSDPATPDACRRRAHDYDWQRVVRLYEDVYASLADRPGERGNVRDP